MKRVIVASIFAFVLSVAFAHVADIEMSEEGFGSGTAGLAYAGGNEWVATGLEGKAIRSLAIDPSAPATIYAGTWGNGVFKSADAGEKWTPVNTGITKALVYALAIDPTAPATVYAGTYGGGVYKSTDGGQHWTAMNTGLINAFVYAVTIDPNDPRTVYAGTWGEGVFKTTDGAVHWLPVNTESKSHDQIMGKFGRGRVQSLAIDQSAPGTIYAATRGGGVLKSTDGGSQWKTVNSGFTSSLRAYALALHPTVPKTLYASADGFANPNGGVYKSTDGGRHWTAVNAGIGSLASVCALAINPMAPATVYAATDGSGVFITTDGGGHWMPMNTGLTSTTIYALAIDTMPSAAVYAGTGDGVFKSIGAFGR